MESIGKEIKLFIIKRDIEQKVNKKSLRIHC